MMNEFDQKYIDKVLSLHDQHMRLNSDDDAETRIWHLLRSLMEYCDAQRPRINLDLILKDVRNDFASDPR